MEEARNCVGLKSWPRESLQPIYDVKNEGTAKDRVALANSLNKVILTPLTTCHIDGREGVWILDGVQRWKLVPQGTILRCYHIGTITEEDATRYWFMLDIKLQDNILKVMDMLNGLNLALLFDVARCSMYDEKDFIDFKKLLEFDWKRYIKKVSTNNPVQASLFDDNEE